MSVVTECVSVSVSEPEYVPALESQRHDLREPMVAGVSVVPVATVIGGDFVIFIFVVIIVVRGGTVLFFIISFFDVKGLFNIGDGRASIVGTLNGLIDIMSVDRWVDWSISMATGPWMGACTSDWLETGVLMSVFFFALVMTRGLLRFL